MCVIVPNKYMYAHDTYTHIHTERHTHRLTHIKNGHHASPPLARLPSIIVGKPRSGPHIDSGRGGAAAAGPARACIANHG